jgi:hypothetical protein
LRPIIVRAKDRVQEHRAEASCVVALGSGAKRESDVESCQSRQKSFEPRRRHAVARWRIVVIGVVLVFVILVFGGPFEKAIDRRWPWRPAEVVDRSPDTTRGN